MTNRCTITMGASTLNMRAAPAVKKDACNTPPPADLPSSEPDTQNTGFLQRLPLVSIGTDIRRPGELVSAPMGDILAGIGSGRWAPAVERVRELCYRSPEQLTAKEGLPYWTPAGLFHYRSGAGLIDHSGHVAIDLDDLEAGDGTRVMQTAVADPHCKCAFRSATARGVRLIFACPPCRPIAHRSVFERAAAYVLNHYGVEPDLCGSDVARACFVSWDGGLWLNPEARMLPGLTDTNVKIITTHKDFQIPVCGLGLSEGDTNTLAFGLGESRAPYARKPDGTCYTHELLMHLARDLVVRFRRHRLELTLVEIDRAFRSWWSTGKRKGLKFREHPDVYRDELLKAVRCVQDVVWLSRVVNYWPRWTQEPDFPVAASSEDRLEYAIRRHCAEEGTDRFFLSARDAATITGTCFSSANDTLHRLACKGVLERLGKPQHARHAQAFRLRPRRLSKVPKAK